MNTERTPIAWIEDEVAIAKANAEKVETHSESYVRYTARQEALEHVAVILDHRVSVWLLNQAAGAQMNMENAIRNGDEKMEAKYFGQLTIITDMMEQVGIPHIPENSQ